MPILSFEKESLYILFIYIIYIMLYVNINSLINKELFSITNSKLSIALYTFTYSYLYNNCLSGVIKRGDVTVKLAEFYGFCWGVERAIAMAYEARSHFPNQKIHITNEIIHNPQVNERLNEMDIKFLKGI